jgi:hypothetical protein
MRLVLRQWGTKSALCSDFSSSRQKVSDNQELGPSGAVAFL